MPARRTLLLPLLLGACSPVDALNALAPREGQTQHFGIAYAAGPRHTLDIYAPANADGPAPVVVFFYGGHWDSGDRTQYRFVGAALAAEGIVTVIPDYRVYPEVRFPAFMEDGARAIAWTRANAASFGGDRNRIALMGHSAGAQIATLLALDPRYLRAAGADPARDIAAVVGLAGPYDFLPLHDDELKVIFGPEQAWKQSQPIDFVSASAPPMLLAAGADDDVVDPGNTLRLAAALRNAGAEATDIIYPGIGHSKLIGAMARPFTFLAPVRRDVQRFVAAAPSREI
jgi:acetyl esterase/lipase